MIYPVSPPPNPFSRLHIFCIIHISPPPPVILTVVWLAVCARGPDAQPHHRLEGGLGQGAAQTAAAATRTSTAYLTYNKRECLYYSSLIITHINS